MGRMKELAMQIEESQTNKYTDVIRIVVHNVEKNKVLVALANNEVWSTKEDIPCSFYISPSDSENVFGDVWDWIAKNATAKNAERIKLRYAGVYFPSPYSNDRAILVMVNVSDSDFAMKNPNESQWMSLSEILHLQDPMLYVAYAEIHASIFGA